jgi:hypothetical protein
MRQKSMMILLVISILLLATGCTSLMRDRGDTQMIDDFHVGTEGVVLEFFEGSPPNRIYEGDPLSIIVKYANRGATTVEYGKLYISGYDPYYVDFQPREVSFTSLEGRSIYNPEGLMFDTWEFNDPAVNMPTNVDVFPQTFKITGCYKYRTEAAAEVCIDPDPLRVEVEDKVCIVHDVGLGSQGAPVAVTSVQQDMAKNKVNFKVSISNVGTGTVISSHQGIIHLEDCHKDLGRDEVNEVEIDAWLSGKQLTCKPDIVRLVNGAGYSFCQGTVDAKEAYSTILNVNLRYGYKESIARRVDILRLPGD